MLKSKRLGKKKFKELLLQEGLKREEGLLFVDEMRVGLLGQSRRVWGIRGEKIRQRIELRYRWSYLLLGVDVLTGRLRWEWLDRVRGEEMAQVLERWKAEGVKGVVWDNAPFHRCKKVGKVGLKRIYQPPYSPEVNPVERVFEEVRRYVEGRVYGQIEIKRAAVEQVLMRLAKEEKILSLVGWTYIREALNALPK